MSDSISAENETILVYKIIEIIQNETVATRILEKAQEIRFFLVCIHGKKDDKNCPLYCRHSIYHCKN